MHLTLKSLRHYCTEEGDCWLWKLGTLGNGYPQARVDGKGEALRQYVFCRLLKNVVKPRHVVTTTCGSRLCLNPRHLHERSRSEVLRGAHASGARCRPASYQKRLAAAIEIGLPRLDWHRVEDIRSRPKESTHAELAREFGVSERAISNVRRNITWRQHIAGSSVFRQS